MHNHVIAGDFGYLPTYSDEEGYTYGSEALEGLKEYVNMVVDSTEGSETPDQYDSIEKYWLATGVVTDIGTDGSQQTIQAVFNRKLASIDYAEITVCYEDCKAS
jgi:hypothetical protein